MKPLIGKPCSNEIKLFTWTWYFSQVSHTLKEVISCVQLSDTPAKIMLISITVDLVENIEAHCIVSICMLKAGETLEESL